MFETLKQTMLDKIESNSIKVNVSGDKIYLKKSGFMREWHVIYPPVDPETGNWNLTNLIFGSARSALISLIVAIIILLFAGVYLILI